MGQSRKKAELKCASTTFMAPSVIIAGVKMMQKLCAETWDTEVIMHLLSAMLSMVLAPVQYI